MPWRDNTFDAVITTFALSAVPDARRAVEEMARVTRPGGRVIITDAGEAPDGNLVAHLLAKLWEFLGDYMRDETPIMHAAGLEVYREAFGPWKCIHTVVGVKPAAGLEVYREAFGPWKCIHTVVGVKPEPLESNHQGIDPQAEHNG